MREHFLVFKTVGLLILLSFHSFGYAMDTSGITESFLDLHLSDVLFLLFVGFVGGLVSGFIGSGGAFVLTPAMMSMGVPGLVAVASNMCHKFPKALVGAMKRAKYGQVDLKLGIVMGISAEAGVLVGAHVQEVIKASLGNEGSNLYVSVVFVVVLAIVGSYVLRDAWKIAKVSGANEKEETTKLAQWVQSIHIPGTMMYFESIQARISFLFTLPLGFATGMLAATIAVGGFIGVPSMMYILGVPSLMASATELVIAFVMGMGGTIKFAWGGFVDIRLAMIILAGSLFGIQLGAIGTTYVKPYMVKLVMGVIMMLVLVSRGIMIPLYLSKLGYMEPFEKGTADFISSMSFFMLISALLVGGLIVLYALWSGRRAHLEEERFATAAETALPSTDQGVFHLPPFNCFERMLVATDHSPFSAGALRQAISLAQRGNRPLYAMTVLVSNPEYESLAPQLLEKEKSDALTHLEQVKGQAAQAGVKCEALLGYGTSVHEELANEAERSQMDIIIIGRRGKSGLMRLMMGSTTAKVLGYAPCCVLVTPRSAVIEGRGILLAVDGSRHSHMAAMATVQTAKYLNAPVTTISVVHTEHKETRHQEAENIVKQICGVLHKEGIHCEGKTLTGRYAETIVETARTLGCDLIVMGSHGRTGLEKMLIGSVSERVIGLSECAVLVVKA